MSNKAPKDLINGSVFDTKFNGKLRVIGYINRSKVHVEFIETGYKTYTRSDRIRFGRDVRDPMNRRVFGVGFVGIGLFGPSSDVKAYQTWAGMLERCYCKKYQSKKPTYKGCTVADEWHNFQVFSKWFYQNYIDGLHLDKDMKAIEDKIYSPETCEFITQMDNSIASHAKNYRLKKPDGTAVNIYNLTGYCRDNGISQASMWRLHSGEINEYKGWTRA